MTTRGCGKPLDRVTAIRTTSPGEQATADRIQQVTITVDHVIMPQREARSLTRHSLGGSAEKERRNLTRSEPFRVAPPYLCSIVPQHAKQSEGNPP